MANFTKEQLLAIEAQGKTLVSASAGSGKTTVMIEKIIRLIESGGNVSEILAVTFTKKAASQMKEKLSNALIKAINRKETTPEQRIILKRQLSEVPMADISTIHSFCAKLLRTHFFAVGVDNTFRVIGSEDAEGTVLQNEALDELLEEGYESKDEAFQHLLSVYWRKKSDRALRQLLMTTYRELRNRADYLEYLDKNASIGEEDFENLAYDVKKKMDEKCRYYYELIEDEHAYFIDDEKSAQRKLSEELMSFLEELMSAPTCFEMSKVVKPKFTINGGLKKLSEEKLLHAKRIGFLKERIVKVYESECSTLLSKEVEREKFFTACKTAKALAKYLKLFDEKYERLKGERGVLDYNDLEHKALKLLENEEIRTAVRNKYKYVFVDEYQDVNPVQEELIVRIGGENVFLVGDVKQAIYGFRGSKSKFFVDKQREFDEGVGQNLYMSRNFRSSDAVLDAVNAQFILAMTPRVCSVDYARGSVMEKGGRYALNDGRVAIHFLGKEEKEAPIARGVYSVRAESGEKETSETRIAKLIRKIIEEERGKTFYDPDLGEYREVRYADIAVLSRKKQGMIVRTIESLASEGVPVTTASAVNICEFTEIKLLIDLLSLLDNAQQDVPLCSVLLSSVGKLTADDLANIRLAYRGEKTFRGACRLYAEEKEDLLAYKLKTFEEYFTKIRKLSHVLDAGELLLRVLADTRMEAELLTKPSGGSALKRIHRFIEESMSPEPLSLHAFLERLRDLNYKIEYSENGGEDSVKVMTMHSSKGLEFPIVILDNLSAPFRGVDREEVYVEEKYGLAPYAFDGERMTKSTTLLRRLYEMREKESSIADDLNLYYVALTRAKYGLHMVFNESTVMADVKYAHSFADFTDFSVWEKYVVEDFIFDLPKLERKAMLFHPDEELARSIMRAFTWQYPFAGFENLPVKSSATHLLPDYVERVEEGTEEVIFFQQGETSKEAGTAYHAFLEIFDFAFLYGEDGRILSKTELTELVEKIVNEGGMVEMKQLSVAKLVDILSNPVFQSLQGKRLYREQKFLVTLPVEDTYAKSEGADARLAEKRGEEMIFQGAIDLLALDEFGNAQIIDYKYSKGSAEYLRQHYRPQLDLYKKAVAKILHIPEENISTSIINIYHGFQVDMDTFS